MLVLLNEFEILFHKNAKMQKKKKKHGGSLQDDIMVYIFPQFHDNVQFSSGPGDIVYFPPGASWK